MIVRQALANLRMPKAARKLMEFYAACGTGFRPSLKVVDDATHINVKHVSTVRAYLVQWGFIAYDGDCITIDWNRLKAFAAMDPKLMGNKKDWRVAPLRPKTRVHNYIVKPRDPVIVAYEALDEAIKLGVVVPGLEQKEAA